MHFYCTFELCACATPMVSSHHLGMDTCDEAVSETTCGMEESGSDEGEVTSWHARCKTNISPQE